MDYKTESNLNPQEKFVRSEKIASGSDGWLSPKGNYYKVGTTQHDESADFLVKNTTEVKDEEKRRFRHSFLREDYDIKSSRFKLEELGWVLIRGNVLHSNDALNYSTKQLRLINEAGIKIVSAFDGSKAYSSAHTLEFIAKVSNEISAGKMVAEARKIVASRGEEYSDFEAGTLRDIDSFEKDIFHNEIHTESVNPDEDVLSSRHGKDSLPAEIFDTLSDGFSEEMFVNNGRYSYCFRLLDIGDKEKLIVQARIYHHDGLSGGMHGAVENWISVFVVDEFTLLDKIQKLISKGSDDVPFHGTSIGKDNDFFIDLWKKIPDELKGKLPLSFAS